MRTTGSVFYVEITSTRILVKLMEANGYSIQDLATRVGVSKSCIGHLHSGARTTTSLLTAKGIEKALDCPGLFTPTVVRVASTKAQKKAA